MRYSESSRYGLDDDAMKMLVKSGKADKFIKSIVINKGMSEMQRALVRVVFKETANGQDGAEVLENITKSRVTMKLLARENRVATEKAKANAKPGSKVPPAHIAAAKEFLASLVEYKDV